MLRILHLAHHLKPVFSSSVISPTVARAMSKAAYGSWKSPITSAMLVDKAARISSVQLDRGAKGDDSVVFWTELRASEKGRSVVCSKKIGFVNTKIFFGACMNLTSFFLSFALIDHRIFPCGTHRSTM